MKCRAKTQQTKRAEEAIRNSEERLSAFINSASDSFYLLDSGLNFIERWYAKFLQLLKHFIIILL